MDYKIYLADPFIEDLEIDTVVSTLKSGWISQGPKTKEFEKQVASICGTKHAVAMCNGTASLHAALLAIGVTKESNVICPSMSYISTSNSILYCGAKPKFADIEIETFNLCSRSVQDAIDKDTKAILIVDLKGQPADYEKFLKISLDHDIPIIADSAQSFGASYNGGTIGSQALMHSFSMFANKNITSGEGGIISTNNDDLAEKLRVLRNQGQENDRYVHQKLGFNYRYNDVLASIAISQISRLEKILEKKQKIANIFNSEFQDCNQITIPFCHQKVTQHSWYHYTLRFMSKKIRDNVQKKLEKNGVETRIAFPPIHLQPMFNNMFKDLSLPNTMLAYETMLDIPCHAKLTSSEINLIIKIIKKATEK